MDLKKELDVNDIFLMVLHKDTYSESLLEIIELLKGKRICYVTLNKTAESIHKALLSNKIPVENVFFIDAVSEGINADHDQDNIVTVSSPAALTELSIAISEAIKSKYFDVFVFDSLSTLNVYDKHEAVEIFTFEIMNRIKAEAENGIFTCLEADLNTELVKNCFMHVDKVLRLK
jgi:archaellum biogenesis ATPase FlaH